MRNLLTLIPEGFYSRKIYGIPMRMALPILVVALLIGGIFSPLFDLNAIHGIPGTKLYFQHLYFDSIAGLGGFWAASFCPHWYHKVFIMIGIDLLATLALVTLVG